MGVSSTYLVIFEVEQRFASTVVANIKNLGNWAQMTSSAFMLATNHTPGDVMERLQPLIGPRDSLWLVSPITPWTGYGDPTVEDYLTATLGEEMGDWMPKDWDDAVGTRR